TTDPTVYSVTGNTFSYTNSVAVTATTNTVYDFTFTDSKGCKTTSTTTVQPKTDPKITSALQVNPIFCNESATGSINVVIDYAFGASPYVINILNTTKGIDYGTQTAGLPAGNYIVTVTDAKGCTDTVNTAIAEPTPIIVLYTIKDIECDPLGGVSKGSIIINSVTGGTPGYTYHVTGNNYDKTEVNSGGTSVTFDIVDFGLYQIKITDSNNCEKEFQDVLVASPPNKLNITVTSPPANCTTGGSATVAVGSAFSGIGPFYFSIYTGTVVPYPSAAWIPEDSPGSKQATFNNLTPGVTYTFVVYDDNSKCYYFETKSAAIPTNSTLISSGLVASNISCKGSADGNIKFTVTSAYGIVTPISYEIFDVFTRISTGVTGTDIIPANGSVTITSSNLNFGNYYVLIKETGTATNSGCSIATVPFVIRESSTVLILTATSNKNANCKVNSGQVSAFGQGGTVTTAVPYLYQIFTDIGPVGADVSDVAPAAASFLIASHTANSFNVNAGNYLIYVRDANGCIAVAAVTVVSDPIPFITALASAQCTATEGTFTINVTLTNSGVGTHTYSLDGGAFEAKTAPFTYSNLSSGSHTVEVKDANDCGNKVINIMIYPPLDINASFTTLPTCKDANGTITAVVAGGFVPNNFEYTLVNNTVVTANVVQLNNPVFLGQAAGNYTITVRDINTTCTKTTTIDLLVPTDVVFTSADITITSPNCVAPQGNVSNGSIEVLLPASNNNPPYTYILTPTSFVGLAVSQVSNGLFTGLISGNYDVTVTSDNDCSLTLPVTIADPTPVLAAANASVFTCSSTNTLNATIVTLTGSGGAGTDPVADYSFSDNGVVWKTTNTFNVFDNGLLQNLTYYVRDANNCVDDVLITIDPFPKLVSVVAVFGAAIDCVNNQQEIIVTITGGTNSPNPFTYNVYQDGTLLSGPTAVVGNSFTYNATTVGSYYEFEVIDNNTGCNIKSVAYDVPVFNTMTVTASAATNVDCATNATGAIEINIGNYTGAYTYEIFNGAMTTGFIGTENTTTNPFVLPHGLVAGINYTVVVTQTAYPFCAVPSNVVVITEPVALNLSGLVVTNVNQNCNSTGAVLTVDPSTIIGGTPGFMYAFVPTGSIPGAADYSVSPTKTIATSQIAPLFDAYDVYVKDANDCKDFETINISRDPLPTIISAAVLSQCADPAGYRIDVVATGVAPLKYSLDGIQFQDDAFFIVTTPGIYTITVIDKNQCITAVPTLVTVLEPLILAAITIDPTCNTADGQVTLTATGGTVPANPLNYVYSIDGVTYSPSNVFVGLAARAIPYTFYVRDLFTNCQKTVDVTIILPNIDIDFLLSKTDVICNGENNGTITVNLATPTTAINNNPVYTYTINPSPAGMVLVGNVFTNLPIDTYTITVTSGKGCLSSKDITIDAPLPIIVPNPIVSEHGCIAGNLNNYATITVPLPSGGSNVYTVYEFLRDGNPIAVQRGINNIYIETDLLAHSYVINVYDDKGCLGSTTASINAFNGIDFASPAAITVLTPITCLVNEEIQVNVVFTSGAVVPLNYTMTGTPTNVVPYIQNNITGLFSNLTVGSYIITVTNPITGCRIKTTHIINEPNTFDLVVSNLQDVICFGTASGRVDLTFVDNQPNPTNDAGNFNYTITGPVNSAGTSTGVTLSLTTLPVGVYIVKAQLVGAPSCEVETTFTIDGPQALLVMVPTITPISCVPGADGTISVTATGGWSDIYKYELAGPINVAYSDQFYFDNLIPGTYTVSVKDLKGCVVSEILNLKDPDAIIATASQTATLQCNGDTTGEITVNFPTGGQGTNYSYILNYLSDTPVFSSAPQTSPIFSGLSAGKYSVIVIDGLGCISDPTANITIVAPVKVEATLVLANGITCTTNGLAAVTLRATGGTGPYEYSKDQNFMTPLGSFASTITFAVGVGDQQFYVRDAAICVSEITNNVTINALTPLSLSLDLSNAIVYCKGDDTATIEANALGGLGNYVYTLLDSAGNLITPTPTQTTAGSFTNLPAGSYIVRVESADCQTQKEVVIGEPAIELSQSNVRTNVTCAGEGNGKIVITASGGTGVIEYAISPDINKFSTSNVFDKLKPGFYDYIVQDQNGCFIYKTGVEITEPSSIFVTTVPGSEMPEVCVGDNDAAFSINITGGNAPYSVSINNKNGTYTTGLITQTQFDFAGLTGSEHTVYVRDANDCPTEHTVILGDAVKLNPQATVAYNCVSNSASNSVTITVDPSNNPADLDYALDGSAVFQSSNVFTNLVVGLHSVEVRHSNGCIKAIVFGILRVDPLTLILTDGGLNEIVATAAGGIKNYQFSLDGESAGTQSSFIITKSGNYTVTVTDASGCTATATRFFEFIDIKIPNAFTPNGDGNNDTWAPTNTINYKDLTFDVFDRYGRRIGKYTEGQFWDGRYNGAELPSGDYWYVVKIKQSNDGREFVGHFTLYR
ncbi:MAG: T9SS type B sorting domain-containing protein, partial [Flavobacterium micromati]|nr:T9SS type B sorting domain-containing protein [Flavobacterium micromati]